MGYEVQLQCNLLYHPPAVREKGLPDSKLVLVGNGRCVGDFCLTPYKRSDDSHLSDEQQLSLVTNAPYEVCYIIGNHRWIFDDWSGLRCTLTLIPLGTYGMFLDAQLHHGGAQEGICARVGVVVTLVEKDPDKQYGTRMQELYSCYRRSYPLYARINVLVGMYPLCMIVNSTGSGKKLSKLNRGSQIRIPHSKDHHTLRKTVEHCSESATGITTFVGTKVTQ
ncbi:hypothetical protein TNCV_3169571 [Trichonephila clavipes]|nr:hypothetical protein TNCV_3169571 [Trichonephila clavipes]